METYADLPIVFFVDQAAFEAWLSQHHGDQNGVWVKYAKKGTGIPTLTHDEAIDAALCWGWIDSQGRTYDDQYYMVKFTPRRPKSVWSKRNVDRVAELIEAGRMQAPGQTAIDAAKADGRWERAYEGQSNIQVTQDLQTALDQNPKAHAFFDTLTKANRYAFLGRVVTAKRPETRAARIEKFIAMMNNGQTFH